MTDVTLTRRTLLTAATAAAAGACAPAKAQQTSSEQTFDEACEIVIVGSGGAGVSAALSAREKTSGRIVILEKMHFAGGSTRFSCGYFNAVDPERQEKQGIVDSIERHIRHTILSGRGKAKPELVRVLCENALEAYHWVESFGVEYEPKCSQIYGGLFPRSHLPKLPENLDSYIDILLTACTHAGIEIRLGSTVHEILKNDKGEVTGVSYFDEDGVLRAIQAERAVVLASGGFSANAHLCGLHDPRLEGLETTNAAGSTGEVMLAAQKIGAYLTGCDYIECIPLHVHYARFAIQVDHCIFVDHLGKRFIREDDRRDILRDRILQLPQRHGYVIVDNQGFLSCPPSFQRQLKEGLKRQEVFSAASLEELGQLLRLPVANFVQTVERYNGFVRQKSDPDFHRRPESMLYTLEKAPFWACKASMSRHHTMGGIDIDTHARVLNWQGKVIPRLYAAGEVTGGIHGASRLGGNAICDIHVFGRIAGHNAAEEFRR